MNKNLILEIKEKAAYIRWNILAKQYGISQGQVKKIYKGVIK